MSPCFVQAVCRQFRRPLIPTPSQAKITGAAVGTQLSRRLLEQLQILRPRQNVFTVTVDIENDYVPHHIIEGLLSPGGTICRCICQIFSKFTHVTVS
ncbi:hypothetical protein BaRGS_00021511 [Batillaria attramentaria]|uniref:Uncharacterized protein n=1 Tax=Batillaria attramentaria TaxID=370345 RepID=A0ABD0KJA5_9CAEN